MVVLGMMFGGGITFAWEDITPSTAPKHAPFVQVVRIVRAEVSSWPVLKVHLLPIVDRLSVLPVLLDYGPRPLEPRYVHLPPHVHRVIVAMEPV